MTLAQAIEKVGVGGKVRRRLKLGPKMTRKDWSQIRSRFFKYVEKTSKCWLWIGSISKKGYGQFYVNPKFNRSRVASRISYEMHNGSIGKDLFIDHLCRNRACVNPKHIRAVTMQINNIENSDCPAAKNHRKTHCIRGHEFVKENTTLIYSKNRKNKYRLCKACNRAHCARQRLKRKKNMVFEDGKQVFDADA